MSDQEILERVQALLPRLEWGLNEEAPERGDRTALKGTLTEGEGTLSTLFISRSYIGRAHWWQFLFVVGDHELMAHPDPTKYFESLEEAVDAFWDLVADQTRKQKSILRKLEALGGERG